jgi:hypothetical protein
MVVLRSLVRFVTFFVTKIRQVIDKIQLDDDVYIGTKKVNSTDEFYMSSNAKKECLR